MKKLFFATLTLFVSATIASAQIAPITGDILREETAEYRTDKFFLKAEPDNRRALADPAMIFHLNNVPHFDGVAGVEVLVKSDQAAQLELQAVYNGDTYYSFPRRTITSTTTTVPIRWQVANLDKVTSLTLSLRHEDPNTEAQIEVFRLQDFSAFSIKNRLASFTETPFYQTRVADPLEDGKLHFGLTVPEELKVRFKGASPSITFKDLDGMEVTTPIKTPLPIVGQSELRHRVEVEVPVPQLGRPTSDPMTATLSIREDGEDVVISTIPVSTVPLELPSFEVPNRSIEDFSILVKSGELGIYSLCTQEGDVPFPGGAPATNDIVWLAVGNGKVWVIDQLLFSGRRDIEWLTGGPVSFQVGKLGSNIYAFFSAAWQDGREGLCFARAQSTYYVTPSTKNPVWMPSGDKTGHNTSMFRGIGIFELNGDSMIAGLELLPDGGVQARALASPVQTRWVDLGQLPLPGLKEDALNLSTYQKDQDFYILTGPTPQLFHASDSPLRGWKEIPFAPPQDWEDIQLVDWHDQLWAFAIKRINGRGVIVWAPVQREEHAFTIEPDYTFNSVPLRQYTTP